MNTCFTTITNNYDELRDPYVSDGWEYVVFSDRHLESDIWNCIVTDKHNRELKIKPNTEMHRTLNLYVDGSIQIIGDLNEFISEVPQWWSMWKHPHRNTLKQEAKAVVKLKGMNQALVDQQMDRYKKAGFKDIGLAACGVILRDLSDQVVRDMCNDWYDEWLNSCGRDQLSMPYVFWKHGFEMDLFGNDIFNKFFKWGKHL